MTRFSVVIAAFNQSERLLEAIESVQRQTLPAHEIIVVDDGGTDGSAETIRERHPNVSVVVQENRGKGVARNHGAFVATGDWVCFLDHDDLWHPEKLSAVDDYLRRHPDAIAIDHAVWIFREEEVGPDSAWSLRIDFVAKTLDGALRSIRERGTPTNDFAYLQRSDDSYSASLRRIFSTTSALSIRRDVFFKVGGFDPAQANGEDWSLSTNVARLGEWHTVPRALSFQRFIPTADSADPAGMVMILSTLVNHWYSGRPLRERTTGFEFVTQLANYAPEYRQLAQSAIWEALRRRSLQGAGAALWLSMLLLPRVRDRVYAVLPPQLTWRLEHRLLDMRH
jgi:glycosyltransferase involved in cell wall biosynthesis